MRNFTADELKAREVLITAARSLTNVDPSVQPLWDKALEKQGVDMRNMKNSFNPANAEIANTKDFCFLGIDTKRNSIKTILMIAPAEMLVESDKLLKGKKVFRNSYLENKKFVDTLFGMVSEDGFTLEMNAKLIQEIHDFESEKIAQDGHLNIPFIMISGCFIHVFTLRLDKSHFEEIEKLQADIKNGIEPPISDSGDCVLGHIHQGEYLRPWTYYDIFD